MARKWTSFDRATTDAEFRTIPDQDVADLFKATNRTSGRCLFFTIAEEDPTLAVALLGYKKESDEAPKHLVKVARERRGRYLASRRG